MKNALKTYTEAKGKGTPTLKAEKALEVLLEKLDVLRGVFHGFDCSRMNEGRNEVPRSVRKHVAALGEEWTEKTSNWVTIHR